MRLRGSTGGCHYIYVFSSEKWSLMKSIGHGNWEVLLMSWNGAFVIQASTQVTPWSTHGVCNKDLPSSVGSCLCSFPLWNNIAASLSSVVYMCCSWDIFRTLMVQFWKEGVELEDYVFFFIDLFAEGLDGSAPIRPWFRGDQEDYAARNAFRVRQDALSLLNFKGCSLM